MEVLTGEQLVAVQQNAHTPDKQIPTRFTRILNTLCQEIEQRPKSRGSHATQGGEMRRSGQQVWLQAVSSPLPAHPASGSESSPFGPRTWFTSRFGVHRSTSLFENGCQDTAASCSISCFVYSGLIGRFLLCSAKCGVTQGHGRCRSYKIRLHLQPSALGKDV